MTMPQRPDQKFKGGVPLSPGGLSIAQITQAGLLTNSDMVALGLQKDTTGQGTNSQLAAGVPPAVPGLASGSAILQGPTAGTTMYTFASAGRIWAANISYSMGSSGGTGSNQGYARVLVQGGATLAIVECVVVGNPSSDSNTDSQTFPGLSVPMGTVIQIDVNNNVGITGVVQRGSGLVVVSIP
jgi:hypothetical protein